MGKQQIDLETDPPPDLALEVDATTLTSSEDYEALRIPEVWIYWEDHSSSGSDDFSFVHLLGQRRRLP